MSNPEIDESFPMMRWRVIPAMLLLVCVAALTGGSSVVAADAEHAAGEGAEPSLFSQVAEDLALWGLVAFALFLFTGYKLLGGWASRSLSERERIENALIADAEQKNRRAQEMLREHKGRMEAINEEINERLAEAQRDAEYTRGEIISIGRRESDILRNRAIAEINRTRNQALNDLFSTMASRVIERAETNMKGRLSDDEHNRLIDEALNHFARS